MRWFIEVSSGNPTGPAEQWVVEAPQWQPALQQARVLRGEPEETTGFSIELLEDGFRVIDPTTLVRYVVRRAPDGTPLSNATTASAADASPVANGAATDATRAAPSVAAPGNAAAPSAPIVAAPASASVSTAPSVAAPTRTSVAVPVGVLSGQPASSVHAPAAMSSAPAPDAAPAVHTALAGGSTAPSATASGALAPASPPHSVAAKSSRPPAVAPDMSGMTQAERIAAMLSVDATQSPSSRAPRGPSNAPKSAAPKSAAPKSTARSVPAASTRNGGGASRPPRPSEGTPSSAPGAVLRAPQGAALRAPRAAAVVASEPPQPVAPPPSAAPPEASAAPLAESPPIEPHRTSQPPPPRLITQPPSEPAVVQSLSELQALVQQNAPPRPASSAVPRPSQPPPAAHASQFPAAPIHPSQPPAAPVHASQPPATAQPSQPPAVPPRVSTAPPSPSSAPEPLPMAELLFQRSEDPSAASPLTYREAAWAVPEGTSIPAAVRLLAGMFEGVRAALAGVKPGKLVYMAIFDHRFVGKPTRPPLATLTWKDWKDQGQGPEIRRQGEPRTSFQPPPLAVSESFIPAAVPQPAVVVPPAPLPSVILDPSLTTGVAGGARESAAPGPVAVPAAPPVIVAPPAAIPSAPPSPVQVATSVPAQAVVAPGPVPSAPPAAPVAPVPVLAASPVSHSPGVEAQSAVAPPAAPHPSAPAPQVAPAAAVAASAPMLVIVPEPVTPPPVAPPSVAPPVPAPRVSVPSAPSVRLSGVELIADLFECMHDLHFLPDALTGADFVLSLMLDKLPSATALVHFYDINAREFVVVRAVGTGASHVMQVRTSEKEPLIAEAMRKRRAVVLDDAASDPRAQNGRWALVGGAPRSLVCAPVEEAGRFLGLLELANPLDGKPFHESDGHAITYIGEQFAEFLAARGVILDPERIGD